LPALGIAWARPRPTRALIQLALKSGVAKSNARQARHVVVVIFEGRDAAGKGGVIKRITESLNPRVCKVVALGTPTERERGQWYFQRYVPHLPARGEIVLFDRSWYNRAGVERVMGFCTDERISASFCASRQRRFKQRETDPLKAVEAQPSRSWPPATTAGTNTRAPRRPCSAPPIPCEAPWTVINSDCKKRARLNAMRLPADAHDSVHRPRQRPTWGKSMCSLVSRPAGAAARQAR
jgi:polyphosphate kinase 2 (PPK2 family)